MKLSSYHQVRYGPDGQDKPQPDRCAYECYINDIYFRRSQCLRKRSAGPEKAFCAQHAKKFEAQPA